MKIAFFTLREEFKNKIVNEKPFGEEHEISFYDGILDAGHIPDRTDFDVLSVFVDSYIDAAVLSKFNSLKFIATRSTGYDHIDLEACSERGIKISNIPTYGENTVAEHAFGLLLALSKRVFDGYDQLRRDGSFNPEKLQGFDLMGKTLGVVGTGNIGKHSIKIGNGFGMKVIAYDAFPKKELGRELDFEYKDNLEGLLSESDVVTLHVPYLKATYHLINTDNIDKIKRGAVLINTSRGAIVETAALVKALKEGFLYGAGLDVVEEEGVVKDELAFLADGDNKNNEGHDLKTLLANHVLIDMPNVIMTPHSAFNTKEALERILNTTIRNIEAFLDGKPVNMVER